MSLRPIRILSAWLPSLGNWRISDGDDGHPLLLRLCGRVNDAEETYKNDTSSEQRTFKRDKYQSVYSYIPYFNKN